MNGGMNDQRFHGMVPPQSIRIQPPLPMFPPELTAAMDAARRSNGRWMVAVWHHDDNGNINLQWTRGGNWAFDWIFRAFAQFRDLIHTVPLPTAPADVPQDETDQ